MYMRVDKIKLNFLDKYYMFYDWLETDAIENVSNLMLYKVSSKVLSEFIQYKIKLSDSKLISNSQYAIFSDGFSYIAIEFDEQNISAYKSSLLLNDEIRLNNLIDAAEEIDLKYEKISADKSNNDLRINEEIRQTIEVELNNIKENLDIDKLKYLYYEWFKKTENNFDTMFYQMSKKLIMPLTKDEKYIYELIKKSYRLV